VGLRNKILAAASVLTLAGGLAAAGAASIPAKAATPSCGAQCVELYNRAIGHHFDLDVFRGAPKVAQPIILFSRSNTDAAQDFTVSLQGTVADFYAAGLISGAVAHHYGCTVGSGQYQFPSCAGAVNAPAFELEYQPLGQDTGLCMGTPSLAGKPIAVTNGTKVALEPCGEDAATIWIVDTNRQDVPTGADNFVGISGAQTNFSHPYVLTYPGNGYPTDVPRPQLFVHTLQRFSQGSPSVYDNEIWRGVVGVLP